MTLLALLNLAEAADYTPSIADIGTIMRARTKDTSGDELGTFTDATRPTGDDVAVLIDQAVDEVWGQLGHAPVVTPLDEATLARFFPRVRRATALYAAMLVEASFWPEQINDDQSPFEAYRTLYEKAMEGLVASVTTDPGDRQGIASIGVASPTSTEFDALGAAGRAWYVPDERWPAF